MAKRVRKSFQKCKQWESLTFSIEHSCIKITTCIGIQIYSVHLDEGLFTEPKKKSWFAWKPPVRMNCGDLPYFVLVLNYFIH